MQVKDKKGFFLSLILLVFIAAIFWTQSRFPALDEKSQMGQRTNISALAFDVIYPLEPDQSHIERILNSAINWGYTNWKGMTFGILFAAAFLAVLSFISFRPAGSETRSNHFLNALKGSLFGTPLGVCANCSTPVAFGMYRSGLPVASALSMLSSSPTLNVVVLTMSFSLLPFELLVVKYVLVVLFICLFIPLALKFSGQLKQSQLSVGKNSEAVDLNSEAVGINSKNNACSLPMNLNWWQSFTVFLRIFLQSLWQIIRGTLPFMLLAGLFAAVLAEFVSLDALLESAWSFEVLILVACLAAFFPVPIAFDVIISVGLLAMGVPYVYVGAIFFGLGIFSIYPAMMIARDLSLRLSVTLMLVVITLAVLAGYTSQMVMERKQAEKVIQIDNLAMSYLPLAKAKPIVRKAARLCHRLGEPMQYQCFETFVLQTLSTQFAVKSCQYLEDAIEYRAACEQAYRYLAVSKQARQDKSLAACSLLNDQYQTACEYDTSFEQVVNSQSLKPCLSIHDQASKARCIDDGLAVNLEMYDSDTICQALPLGQSVKLCEQSLLKQRQAKKILALNDLKSCLVLESAQQVQHCQGVIMVNQLEQGASIDICKGLDSAFLKYRCQTFYQYFQSIEEGEPEACVVINDESLRARCELESIQHNLAKRLQNIRFDALKVDEEALISNHPKGKGLIDAEFLQESDDISLTFKGEVLQTEALAFVTASKTAPKDSSVLQGLDAIEPVFEKLSAESVGLEASPPMSMTALFEPFSYGRGISSGDFNQDGWPDLVSAHANQIRVHQNLGLNEAGEKRTAGEKTGRQFRLAFNLVLEGDKSPMLVALVDLNGDAWLDIFVTLYGGESRVYINQEGVFTQTAFQSLSSENSQLTMSAGFADPDKDGDVDIVMGGWSFGDLRHFNPVRSQNYYAENKTVSNDFKPKFELKALKGVQGETLSVLLSDFNGDNQEDLIVANDMDSPDALYQWSEGSFSLAKSSEGLPNLSSFNTMSVDSGDFNHDLRLDYFSVDMSFTDSEGVDYCAGLAEDEDDGVGENKGKREGCQRLVSAVQALRDGDATWCQQYTNISQKKACVHAQIIQLAKQSGNSAFCHKIPVSNETLRALCMAASMQLPPKQIYSSESYLAAEQKNVLLISSENGYDNVASAWGVAESHWSWNAKIADLDNDGWQDIYVGNGFLFGGLGRHVHSNVFFHNQAGKGFKREEVAFGLVDYLNTPSFTYIDFDQDGDLDIVSNRVSADLGVFINHSQQNAIRFSLRDERKGAQVMSRSILGSKISIFYGEDSKEQQLREIKMSGGFLSFDQAVAHFGLGQHQSIARLLIEWPDGQKSEISTSNNQGVLNAGYHYIFTRH
mgnify:CR=1 FL=1